MKKFAPYWMCWAVGLALMATLSGCELDDDPSDHDVPPGKGLLVVDNNSSDDIAVYIDGERQEDTDDFDDRAYPAEPGVRRVILDQRSGSRTFRDDVDILEGKRTILDVSIQSLDNDYDVSVYFD